MKGISKILLSTKSFPPVVGGSAFLLYELLRHFPDDYFEVVHGVNDPPGKETDLHLHFRRKQVVFINQKNTPRAVRRIPRIYSYFIRYYLQHRVNKGWIKKIYAHYPNAVFLVAAYRVAKKNKLPLIVYFDILWEELANGNDLELAKRYEKEIVAYATKVCAITEFAVDHLTTKHSKPVTLIPHTVDTDQLDSMDVPTGNDRRKVPKIHFAGGIHEVMNTDSVLRLVETVEKSQLKIELEFCSPDLPVELIDKGYVNRYLPKDELIRAQRDSSILYLPQAFRSSKPTMIKNNFPTKAMEYVTSGIPILVHSPKDSYLTHIAKKEGFAFVVDEEDPIALLHGINRILDDNNLQKELVKNAIRFAKSRDSRKWADLYREVLEDEIATIQ
jgi:glycosyltransferase involved in cell wall biosynthesis